MLKSTYKLPELPPPSQLETIPVLKALAAANRALAELKGQANTIPNQGILIDTLSLQEARASSEIENIVTTQDELFQADLFPENLQSGAAKEVALYRDALKLGFTNLRKAGGVLSNNSIIAMFQALKARTDGFRNTPGTALKNDRTGEIVYVPPQDSRDIQKHMDSLERYINEDRLCSLDPLIKMAIIHHQFESIHPFPDGNGRVGRILNVLYLTRTDLLEIPILYLSRHITKTKSDYYRLLQNVRDTGGSEKAWEEWILYMLEAVARTSETTLELVIGIREQMAKVKHRLRGQLPNLYSQELLNNLFKHPYTRIEFVAKDLDITRQTAAKHLDKLAEHGFVKKHQAGRKNYYINTELVLLLAETSP
jgi:Fic family protein